MATVGHTRSGPMPDADALRRDRDASMWTRLPAHRTGEPPVWPLPKASARERVIWTREWTRGQAVMWEALGWEVQVAHYVRQLVVTERRGASEAAKTTMLRMEDGLGISYPGLQRNRWILAAEPRVEAAGGEKPVPMRQTLSGPSAKDRLRKRGMGIVGESA